MRDSSTNTNVARQIEIIIRRLSTLSTLPEVAAGFLTNLTYQQADMAAFSEIVESDPALTARILSLAYTEQLTFKNGNPTVQQALAQLPQALVRDAVISMKVIEAFDARNDSQNIHTFTRKQLALHALATACCAKEIAQLVLPENDRALAFSAGLLHDIGKLALDQVMPKSFAVIIQEAKTLNESLRTVEQRHLGLDHALIGKRLAEKWHLPDEIAFAIWMHHSDTDVIAQNLAMGPLAHVISLADIIARQCGIGHSGSCDIPVLPEDSLKSLSLSSGQIEGIKKRLHVEVNRRSELLGFNRTDGPAAYCQALHKTAENLSESNSQLAGTNDQLNIYKAQLRFITDFNIAMESEMNSVDVAGCFADLFKKHYQSGPVVVYLVNPSPNDLIEAVTVDDSGQAETFVVDPVGQSLMVPPEIRKKFTVINAPDSMDWLLKQIDTDIDLSRAFIAPLFDDSRVYAVILFEQRFPARVEEFAESLSVPASIAAKTIKLVSNSADQRFMSERFAAIMSQLKDARQQLVDDKSFSGLAEMAAGAAHELNNPLAVISGRAQLLFGIETEDNKKQMLKQIQDRTKEVADIVGDLMSFARPKLPSCSSVNLQELIEFAIALAAEKAGNDNPEMNADAIGPLLTVNVDEDQITTAIANLLLNAIESYPGFNGPVSIELTSKSDTHISFTITDSGCGMTADVLANAFEPFYSEKPAGRQRGMGLTQAKRLIEINAGRISISSQINIGTTVTVTLPIIQ